MNKLLQEYDAYDDALERAKALIAGEAVSTAITVRMRNGEVNHTDGPLAETKEQLGGFYLIDVPDREQALTCAAKCPSASSGSIEVRPLMNYDPAGN